MQPKSRNRKTKRNAKRHYSRVRLPGQNYADQTVEFPNSKLGQYYTQSSYLDLRNTMVVSGISNSQPSKTALPGTFVAPVLGWNYL